MPNRGTARVATPQPVRCAIYTRKSTDEGLEQAFNSLHAQRESAEAYILSQRDQGWTSLPEHYDDGAFTGANLTRPALQRLIDAVSAGAVDCVVVYKVDRLTRSIRDLMYLLETLDAHDVTLVSVTESFNTTTPAGRMTLNLLLTFAQYEREMTAERTRDKMRAARRKGKWIGGNPPLGYDVAAAGGALMVNATEAAQVREIFELYLELGSLIPMIEELDRRGWRMKHWVTREGKQRGGARFNKTTLHNLLTNVVYTGCIRFEGKLIGAEHEAIVSKETFHLVQAQLQRNGRRGGRNVRNKHHALLKGIAKCGTCGCAMIHTFTRKPNRIYNYYVCRNAHTRGWAQCQTHSVAAGELEDAVVSRLRACAQHPQVLAESLKQVPDADPGELQEALARFDPLWDQMTTWERESFIRTLVREVSYDGQSQMVTVTFHSEEIHALCVGEAE